MNRPTGVAVTPDGSVLWVADYANHRVLRFDNPASKENGAEADGVLGQPNYTTRNTTITRSSMMFPMGVAIGVDGRLWVADTWNNRVLRFDNAANRALGVEADGMLGQSSYTSRSTTRMYYPRGVAVGTEGTVWVAVSEHHRVLRFNNAATKENGAPADGVLGQNTLSTSASSTTQTGMHTPFGVAVDELNRPWVADSSNHRVLFFGPLASLAVSNQVTPTEANPGAAITYSIAFSNTGSATTTNLLITDTMAELLVDETVSSSGVTLVPQPNTRYAWEVAALPPGAEGLITITGRLATPQAAGSFNNRVHITADGNLQAQAEVSLTVANVAPVVDAGPDQQVTASAVVTLTGTASDANGDALTISWRQTGGPSVTLRPSNALTTTFTAPADASVLTFTLRASDGTLSTEDTVVVTVGPAAPEAPTIDSPAAGAIGPRPTFSGSAEPGSTVVVTDAEGEEICRATADAEGAWSCTPADDLPEGATSFSVTASNAGGTSPAASVEATVEHAPEAPTVTSPAPGSTVGPRPTFSGSAAPGSTVVVTDAEGNG
ncbi:NHL repeat-containing protein, partial [Candidatus Viridilinea mediisalina]